MFVDEGEARDFLHEALELIEKGFVEVEVLAVFCGVPLVAPKTVLAVYGEGAVGVVDGDHFFFAEVAGAFVEGAFIAKAHALARAAVGAGGGDGYVEVFVKVLVLRGYVKGAFAAVAGLCHVAILLH